MPKPHLLTVLTALPDPVPAHTSFLDMDTVSSSVSDAEWPREERVSVSISSSSVSRDGSHQYPHISACHSFTVTPLYQEPVSLSSSPQESEERSLGLSLPTLPLQPSRHTHPAASSSLPGGSPSAVGSSPKPGGSWGPQRGHPSARHNPASRGDLSALLSLIFTSCT